MQALLVITIIALCSTHTFAQQVQDFAILARMCAPSVHNDTMTALVSVESSFNPYAIGVVDGKLSRQPKNLSEALEVVRELEDRRMNYSLGLAQVNKHNLAKHGLSAALAFDPCKNLTAGSKILSDCYTRARKGGLDEQTAVKAALSCYYSGNFTRGFRDGYVQEVIAKAGQAVHPNPNTIKIIKTSFTKPTPENNKARAAAPKEGKRDPAFVF
jgi:type IV secretion system protein VirB1